MGQKIKAVVWDLDNTLWRGILTEDREVSVSEEVYTVVYELDRRGILQSICSKNDYEIAMEKLKEFRLDDMFLYPQISWNPKSEGITAIQQSINIGMDTIAFIDDQEFERDEVHFKCPEVLCMDASEIESILKMDAFIPDHMTEDAKNRRHLYQNDIKRNQIRDEFKGTEQEFLQMLDMKFTVNRVQKDDLARAEELTVRTHQLNATGVTYSYEELDKFSQDDNYLVLIAQLEDKYGDYGKIGLALVEKDQAKWRLKLMLMSCRVMARGVGAVLLNYISSLAVRANVDLYADFVPTDRNRMMYITYKFAGFQKEDETDGVEHLKLEKKNIGKIPEYLTLVEGDLMDV